MFSRSGYDRMRGQSFGRPQGRPRSYRQFDDGPSPSPRARRRVPRGRSYGPGRGYGDRSQGYDDRSRMVYSRRANYGGRRW